MAHCEKKSTVKGNKGTLLNNLPVHPVLEGVRKLSMFTVVFFTEPYGHYTALQRTKTNIIFHKFAMRFRIFGGGGVFFNSELRY